MRRIINFTIAVAILCPTILLTGCQTNSSNSVSAKPAITVDSSASICDINNDPNKFFGKIVRISAKYNVVKNYASYFSDESCGKKSVIIEGNRDQADMSMRKFIRAGDDLCVARGIASLCSLKADVVIDVKINHGIRSRVVADPLHVETFSYDPQVKTDRGDGGN